jgi:Kef-type K+ transport system membrane component KefB
MSLSLAQIAHFLIALTLLLVGAHVMGFLFARWKQPRVLGEITAGILLGPTLFGALLPEFQRQCFPDYGPTPKILGFVYQMGLLLLMFLSGAEIRSSFERGERKTILAIVLAGVALPFAAGMLALKAFDASELLGSNPNETSFMLVFGIALAVTSIPVISRIMFDLGVLETSFARVVLGAAVLEDIFLYVVLAVALGLVQTAGRDEFGLAPLLGIHPGTQGAVLWHVGATAGFFLLALFLGPLLYRALSGFRFNLLRVSNPIAFELVFMLAMTSCCAFLGITPMFGAFLAGLVAGSMPDTESHPRADIKSVSFALFIPAYFALVGLRLDLVKHLDLAFFVAFLAFACGVKALSVWAGARAVGEPPRSAWNLAIAMNARGGPGIVLASVAYDAGIISAQFHVALVLLAIVTSLIAGTWLGAVVRSGQALR